MTSSLNQDAWLLMHNFDKTLKEAGLRVRQILLTASEGLTEDV